MEFSPEITLAALDEVVRPSPRDIGRFGLGNAYAESKARHLMASTHSDLERAPRDLSAIDKALRAWIADGPDTDTDEYEAGYQHVQEQILLILDSNYATVTEYLDDARERAERLYRAATTASTPEVFGGDQ